MLFISWISTGKHTNSHLIARVCDNSIEIANHSPGAIILRFQVSLILPNTAFEAEVVASELLFPVTQLGGTEESRQSIKLLWEAGVDRARRSTGSLVEIQMEAEAMSKELEGRETRPILLPNEKKTCSCEESYTRAPGQIDDKTSLLQDGEMSYAREPKFGSESDLEECAEYSASHPEDMSFTIGLVVGLNLSRKKVSSADDLQLAVDSNFLSTLSETTESLDSKCGSSFRLDAGSARQETHREISRGDIISICSLD